MEFKIYESAVDRLKTVLPKMQKINSDGINQTF